MAQQYFWLASLHESLGTQENQGRNSNETVCTMMGSGAVLVSGHPRVLLKTNTILATAEFRQ
jgi:hypothetical protein